MHSPIKTKGKKNRSSAVIFRPLGRENENQRVVHLPRILSQVHGILLNLQHYPLQQAGETYKSIFNDSHKPYE